MNKPKSQEFNNTRYVAKAGLAVLVVAASMTVGSATSYAAVVCGAAGLPAVVPATLNGTYINLATVTVSQNASVAGWDFNVYASGGNLNFFSSAGAANTTSYVGTGTVPDVLTAGTSIGPASTYAAVGVSGTPVAWRAGVTGGYVGIRFNNEGTVATNYGWVQMTTTAASGFPATITAFCFDNTGAAIIAGTTPVSLQKFSVD